MNVGALLTVLERFAGRRVLVMGDVVADQYVQGVATRLSREAPVPVVRVQSEELRLGGAANVAHNLAALGADVCLLGVVGADATGAEVLRLARTAGIDVGGVSIKAHRATPRRTRIVAGSDDDAPGDAAAGQQLVRLDHDPAAPIGRLVADALREALDDLFPRIGALAIADYGLGTLTPELTERVRVLAGALGAVVTVDSRFDLGAFRGVTAVTPSEAEAAALCGLRAPLEGDAVAAATALRVRERLEVGCVLLTRGRRGMAVALPGGAVQLLPAGTAPAPAGTTTAAAPTAEARVVDATGAGDTVQATFALALAAGADPLAAAQLANEAAALVVRKPGTATVNSTELFRALCARAPLLAGADDDVPARGNGEPLPPPADGAR
ncbi:MAG TPA: PfkB family carbohydrate kinase [Myxococcota bacterium]|jgi:rfaE bifunctional protein kinase chain/domain|nr:PfkB family carbohydrate kinase [Myxococcota bacterium]